MGGRGEGLRQMAGDYIPQLMGGRRQKVEQSLRYLPENLQTRILEAADAELERIAARRQVVKESLARLEAAIADHREETKAIAEPDERGASVKTPAMAERSVERGRLDDWREAHRQELTDLDRQQSEADKVKRCAARGVVHGVLAVTQNWENPPAVFHLQGLRPSEAVDSDPAGNPVQEAK